MIRPAGTETRDQSEIPLMLMWMETKISFLFTMKLKFAVTLLFHNVSVDYCTQSGIDKYRSLSGPEISKAPQHPVQIYGPLTDPTQTVKYDLAW